jgi:LPS sulfotransferase NodH
MILLNRVLDHVPDHPLSSVQAITDAPLFIVGAPRSGTTWVQRLLLAHPETCGGQESHFFPAFAYPMEMFDPTPTEERQVNLSTYWSKENFWEEIRGLWRRTMAPVILAKTGASVLVEKTPQHAQYMNRILDLLPASRFIHVIRDSRSVVASLLAASAQPWGRRWAPHDALTAARTWKSHVLQANKVGAELGPRRYTTVHYEQLRADPVPEIIRLLEFAGLQITERAANDIAQEQAFAKAKDGASPVAANEPPGFVRQGSTDGWRKELSFRQKRIVWKYTGPIMLECGYTRDGWNPSSQPAGMAASAVGDFTPTNTGFRNLASIFHRWPHN